MKKATYIRPALTVDPAWKIAVVASSFYKEEMDALTAGAVSALKEAGIKPGNITVYPAAGSFEVPLIGQALLEAKKVDALIGLGIIVEGETEHARLLAEAATRGIMDVQIGYGIPFAFEILYVDSLKLARARLTKGEEAAYAVLHSLAELKRIRGRRG